MSNEHSTERSPRKPADPRKAHPDPKILGLLKRYRIPLLCVAIAAQCDVFTVRRALDPARCLGVRVGNTARIRARVEALLRAAGWQGEPAELWATLDAAAEAQAKAA